jgi:2-polyprenyl-6-methoxyphenol hydroxylase-like FAD-dependent oxidoreductase
MWPNATAALRSLELLDPLEPALLEIERVVTRAPSGKVMTELPLARREPRFGKLCTVERGRLLASLRSQVAAPIEFGATVTLRRGRLTVDDEPLSAELVVGADGSDSIVREFVVGPVPCRDAGHSVWRGVTATGDRTPVAMSETIGRGKRFGLVPLADRRTYWWAVVTDGGPLESEFAGWHEPIGTALAATPAASRSLQPIAILPPLPRWHRERVVLVGDAAHAMSPALGQGAAQALEDVAALAAILRSSALDRGLEQYERRRKQRAERVAARSRQFGALAQVRNPALAAVREFIGAHMPEAVLVRQFASLLDGGGTA